MNQAVEPDRVMRIPAEKPSPDTTLATPSSTSKAKQSAQLRLRLWLLSSGIGALLWALVLAALFNFISDRLPLEPNSAEAEAVVRLIRDRFIFSFGFTAPLLGALSYFAILLIAGQQQTITETKEKLAGIKAATQTAASEAMDSEDESQAELGQTDSEEKDSVEASKVKDSANPEHSQERGLEKTSADAVLQNQLVALLSREYRTPLTAILSSSELIEHYGENWTPDRIQRHLSRIKASVGVMTSLLNDTLMLVGESETGALTFEPALLNLNPFVMDLVESLEPEADTKGDAIQRIHCKLLTETLSVEGDPNLLRSILTPILRNALTYSPEPTAVLLMVSHDGSHATFTVQDEGIGIPEADQLNVFEPFFRAENAKDKAGTGLGLAVARLCTELHGGELTLSSKSDGGTSVTVTLPMPQRDTGTPAKAEQPVNSAVPADSNS